jgi:PEGA domain
VRPRCLCAFVMASLLARVASAQESPEEQARQAFQRGVAAMQAGRYTTAIAELEFSYGLLPRCSTQFNLAVAFEQTRRYADSLDVFTRYESDCASTMPPQNVTYIADAGRRLRAHLGLITLRITPASAVSAVLVDGRPRPRWSGELALDPGTHSLEVRSGEGQVVRREFQAAEGTRDVVEVSLGEPPQEPVRPLALAPDPYGADVSAPVVSSSGGVRIEAPVAHASVSVDGRDRGEGPIETRLNSGRHLVEVRADGYLPARVALTVRDGALTRLTPRLEREGASEASPFYTRWWFWTLVGAAAVGGAVAITWELTRTVDTPVYTFQAVTSP